MKTTNFQALIIDHHFGELSPEVVELLEHYLAEHPHAREEADKILETLGVMKLAVSPVIQESMQSAKSHWSYLKPFCLALAAAVAVLVSVMALWKPEATPPVARVAHVSTSSAPVAWTKYKLSLDPLAGGIEVLRVQDPRKEGRP